MNKDRIDGSIKQATGAVKETAGKVLGDQKLKTEGSSERLAGKIQNAVGGAMDAIDDSTRKSK